MDTVQDKSSQNLSSTAANFEKTVPGLLPNITLD